MICLIHKRSISKFIIFNMKTFRSDFSFDAFITRFKYKLTQSLNTNTELVEGSNYQLQIQKLKMPIIHFFRIFNISEYCNKNFRFKISSAGAIELAPKNKTKKKDQNEFQIYIITFSRQRIAETQLIKGKIGATAKNNSNTKTQFYSITFSTTTENLGKLPHYQIILLVPSTKLRNRTICIREKRSSRHLL